MPTLLVANGFVPWAQTLVNSRIFLATEHPLQDTNPKLLHGSVSNFPKYAMYFPCLLPPLEAAEKQSILFQLG